MSVRTPSYRLHRPTGQAVVTIDGKDRYLGRHGTAASRAEYDRLVAEWLANGRRLPAARGLSVNELVVAYFRHAESYYVKDGLPTSEVDTLRQALHILRWEYGESGASAFGPLALKAVRQAMVDHGWCRGYVNKQVNRVRRMFAWAVENELLPIVVHQALGTVAGLRRGRTEAREKAPIAPVPDERVERTIPHMPPTVAAMVAVQRLTGMRPGEVVTIRGEDLDRSDPAC